MCGIAGFLTRHGGTDAELRDQAARMSDALAHRGPDDRGSWADAIHGVGFGHRRLAIVDLSPQGAQPMTSACGRYVVAYNGEIYNHAALRLALGGHPWRGHSDTETLLACFSRHGVTGTLPRLVGMFALAAWDRQTKTLTLARDRMGEKPLYFGRLPCGDFVFGSELKALRAHPRWQGQIDRDALALFMRHNVVPAPRSIYRGIEKLAPGRWVELRADGALTNGTYWNLEETARRARASAAERTDAEAVQALRDLMDEAVSGQLMADVPVGAFLSGGIDSSAVVAAMCRQARTRVRTFTIGFDDPAFDEAAHARAVARHLGTDHTELTLTAADAQATIPELPTVYDEPFADSSQIPTLLVSRMTRRHVTVALSGDGGDELFAGYNRYLLADQAWRRVAAVPMPARRLGARLLLACPPGALDRVAAGLAHLVPRLGRHGSVGEKLHKFAANVLCAPTPQAMYRSLVSHWPEPTVVVPGAVEPPTALDTVPPGALSTIEHMSLVDQLTYLPDDILVKVDRAAMASSLETRVPLLDHRVVEFAWGLPMHQKIRGGVGKWLLRQALYQDVPRELFERPKQGFAIPLDRWLRGPLRDWAEALLDPARLRNEGWFDAPTLQSHWRQHLRGERNWQYPLWDALMFQAWLQAQAAPPPAPAAPRIAPAAPGVLA